MGLKSTTEGGEIVQVQGGHIIRATGRKDRHSKVFTAKGPRDRRVRLSAHTAIQFYDVQDRLGYDRPSKAVDWLIKKAKASIDKLAELPPWDPIIANGSNAGVHVNGGGCSHEFHVGDHSGSSSFYVSQGQQCVDSELLGSGGDSMKSFFPMNNNGGNNNNGCGEHSISFQNYPHELMISRGVSQGQDLCLSLHTLQDPSGGGGHQTNRSHDSGLFQGSGSTSLGIEGGGCADTQNPYDLGRFTRMLGWPFSAGASIGNGCGGSGGGDNRGGNFINLPPFSPQKLLLGQQQSPITTATYSQRDSLQSSFSLLVRGLQDHQHHHHQEISNIRQGSDGFMGYYIPSQFHGHEIMHGGANSMSINRDSSSSLSPDSSQH